MFHFVMCNQERTFQRQNFCYYGNCDSQHCLTTQIYWYTFEIDKIRMVLIRLRYCIFSKYRNLLLFNMLINKFSTVILLWLLEPLKGLIPAARFPAKHPFRKHNSAFRDRQTCPPQCDKYCRVRINVNNLNCEKNGPKDH